MQIMKRNQADLPSGEYVGHAVQFPKGFETADLPSGKSYIRITPQPDLH